MRTFNPTNDQDIIIRYNRREMRNYIVRMMAHWRPDILRQFIYQSGISIHQFEVLVEELLGARCSRFAQHSLKWIQYNTYPTANPNLLSRMINYHEAWEGFASSEPWARSRGKKIRYFFDTQYLERVEEMEQEFYRNL